MSFSALVGNWLADHVAARVAAAVLRELEPIMSAESDALAQLQTDMNQLKDTVAGAVTDLGQLAQQIADLKANAGSDPAVAQGLSDLDATVKQMQSDLQGAMGQPAQPPAQPPAQAPDQPPAQAP